MFLNAEPQHRAGLCLRVIGWDVPASDSDWNVGVRRIADYDLVRTAVCLRLLVYKSRRWVLYLPVASTIEQQHGRLNYPRIIRGMD